MHSTTLECSLACKSKGMLCGSIYGGVSYCEQCWNVTSKIFSMGYNELSNWQLRKLLVK